MTEVKTKGFYVTFGEEKLNPDLESQMTVDGMINVKSLKAFNTATRKVFKKTIEKEVKRVSKDKEKEKEKRKKYYERPDIKEKRKQYNERPEVKERKKKLQSKRNQLLKILREKEPELYAKYYLSKLEDEETQNENHENHESDEANVNTPEIKDE